MPRASFDQLTAFVAVAEHGSFSQAARVVGKDRATLHHQVSDLEIDWDVTLFERKGRTPVLTEVGATLLTQAKHILYQMQSLELSCDSYSQGDIPEITICHDMSVPCDAIADIDLSLRKQYRNTAIHWLHRSRDEALEMLIAKQADFAVVLNRGQAFPAEGMSFINLGYPKFTFYAHKHSPIAQKTVVTLQDLASNHQYIAENFSTSALGNQQVMSPNISRISNIDVLMRLLKNDGFALLPHHLVQAHDEKGEFVPLNIDFMANEGRAGYVLLKRGNTLSPVHQKLVALVTGWFDKQA
ncbi:LysR family transcriptional regulator [Vibrio campbellii]|uniref:LysR family transcriptional regulator n=1 Tax=Vibrio campbellii TaxID=680 RepID=UPI00015448B1|nr:putative transcriptional regulator, LysR family [Vibrio campbellii HY01]